MNKALFAGLAGGRYATAGDVVEAYAARYFGTDKAASLKSSAIARYRKGVVKSIERRIFGQKNDEDSICQRLQLYIQRTAEKIVMEID